MRIGKLNILTDRQLRRLLTAHASLGYECAIRTTDKINKPVIMGSIVNAQIREIVERQGL